MFAVELLYRTPEVASMKKKKKKAELDFIKKTNKQTKHTLKKTTCTLQERLLRNERQARDWKKNIC